MTTNSKNLHLEDVRNWFCIKTVSLHKQYKLVHFWNSFQFIHRNCLRFETNDFSIYWNKIFINLRKQNIHIIKCKDVFFKQRMIEYFLLDLLSERGKIIHSVTRYFKDLFQRFHICLVLEVLDNFNQIAFCWFFQYNPLFYSFFILSSLFPGINLTTDILLYFIFLIL